MSFRPIIHNYQNGITYIVKCDNNDVYKQINNLEPAVLKVVDIYGPSSNSLACFDLAAKRVD